MNEHIVSAFDAELKSLSEQIEEMGAIAKSMSAATIEAFLKTDISLAKKTIKEDWKLNQLQHQLEHSAVQLIALRQPVAQDLRDIIAAIRISNDLERVGDLAKNTARRAIEAADMSLSDEIRDGLRHMSQLIQQQLRGALDAFGSGDVDKAQQIRRDDDDVDALYHTLYRNVLSDIKQSESAAQNYAPILFSIKNLERIGDHATNIAEDVIYMRTGEKPSDDAHM